MRRCLHRTSRAAFLAFTALICAALNAALPGADYAPSIRPSGAEGPDRGFQNLFLPFRTEAASLSPDGNLLAYTVHTNGDLYVYVVPIDRPGVLKTKILVLTDQLATPMLQARSSERSPARVRWMRWITPTRLVFETNRVFPYSSGGGWQSATGEVLAVDANGQNALSLANPVLIRPPMSADPAAGGEPADADSSGADLFALDTPIAGPTPGAKPISRVSIRVLGLHPTDPESILVRTEGRTFKVYEINAVTGKRRLRTQEITAPSTLALLDRWGVPRVTVNNSHRGSFPRPFMLEPAGGFARTKPLDGIAGVTGFAISPDTYFGERSVPLGFDENPAILYYASNVGRDTFGVYALDLSAGTRRSAAIETPVADLYKPEPGTFGDASAFGFSTTSSTDTAPDMVGDPVDAAMNLEFEPDVEDPDPNRNGAPSLVFDRFRHRLAGVRFEGAIRSAVWLLPELQAVQNWIHANLQGQTAEIVDWDEAMSRFLLVSRNATNPGAFHVLDRKLQKFSEYARRAPDIDTTAMSAVVPFAFALSDGTRVDGTLALPKESRVKPIPLAILCPTFPWERRGSEYSPEFDALARMGIAVAQFNGRGIWGNGIRQRAGIKAGYEEAQVADILAVVEHLAANHSVSKKRVALVGRGHGGFVALRALQLHPQAFRCAVTIDALVDVGAWLDIAQRDQASMGAGLMREMFGDRARLAAAPLTKHPELIRSPVLTMAYRGDRDASRAHFLANKRLNAAVDRVAPASEFFELDVDHVAQLPKAVAEQWRTIEQFLNDALYDYSVKVGESKEVPDKAASPQRK